MKTMNIRLLFILLKLDFLVGLYYLKQPHINDTMVVEEPGALTKELLTVDLNTKKARYYREIESHSTKKLLHLENHNQNKLNRNNSFTYSWSKWGKWSKCSRACEGGVQIKKRKCVETLRWEKDSHTYEFDPFENSTFKGCVGLYRRFRICNDKKCSSTTEQISNFGQCYSYNNVSFNGKTYIWKPYVNEGSNECESNCSPEGLMYYMTLNTTVLNGTPCRRPAIYFQKNYRGRAVCIEGICKAVHNSGAIRGDTTYDSTERCGSLLCEPVLKFFNRAKLPHGYFHLASIPRGAFNFSASVNKASTNFLAIKAGDVFIINGESKQNSSGEYKHRENRFHYVNGAKGNSLERIHVNNFLTYPVDLLLYVNEDNTGVEYKYFVPVSSNSISEEEENDSHWDELGVPLDYGSEHKNNVGNIMEKANHTPEKTKRKMEWRLVGFGPCNKSCGGGYRAPIFRCTREIPTRYYAPRRCKHVEKPVFNELIFRCNNQECPGYWRLEKWDDCFCNNGKGFRERVVKCVRTLATGAVMQVNESLCLEEKPHTTEDCECLPHIPKRVSRQKLDLTYAKHIHEDGSELLARLNGSLNSRKNIFISKNDKSGVWLMSEWYGRCQAECGPGVQHRSIFCDRTYPFADRCDVLATPDTSRPCLSKQTCDVSRWFVGPWSECMGDCFNLFKKRQVLCIQNENVVNDNECITENKPEQRKNCSFDEVTYCKAKWHYSEWSECSRSCDSGTQRRFAKCLELDEDEGILSESHNCRYLDREPVYSTCNNFKCPETVIERNNRIQSDSELTCQDEFPNCHQINKERLCSLNYYQRHCCHTCKVKI